MVFVQQGGAEVKWGAVFIVGVNSVTYSKLLG